MIDWFRMDSGFATHTKVLDLCDLLELDTADAYVARLWAFCGVSANDGIIPGLRPERTLERAVRWTGEPGKLAAALIRCRIVDRREDGRLEVHGWWELNGSAMEKAKRDRENMKAKRAAKAARDAGAVEEPRPSRDEPPPVARRSRDGRA